MENKNIYEKLSTIQSNLKAPKGQFNSFGKYKYRSCEDILEAVKPICSENRLSLVVKDDIVLVGERYYIKAIATLYDLDSEKTIEATALARESETKKGMDDSQITGTASSYARKYALNGLFNIDDTKDADTDAYTKKTTVKKPVDNKLKKVKETLNQICTDQQLDKMQIAKKYNLSAKSTYEDYSNVVQELLK